MKTIELSQGKVAIVPDDLYEHLSRFKWHAHKIRNTYYARRNIRLNGKDTIELMHRVIMQMRGHNIDRMQVDHRTGDGLNNLDENLRVCTSAENNRNKRKRADNTSEFKGVSWNKKCKKWGAYIKVNGKQIHLGLFHLASTAAKVYDTAAREHFGEFAVLNFPQALERTA